MYSLQNFFIHKSKNLKKILNSTSSQMWVDDLYTYYIFI